MTAISIGILKAWIHPAKNGAPPRARLLIVHGLGEHSARHANTVEALTARGIEVVRFDLRGSGASGGDRAWIEQFDDYVDDVAHLTDYIARELPRLPLFLYGHSLGGAIAIHYAARPGAKIHALVLSAPAYLPGAGVSKIKLAVGKLIARVAPRVRIPETLDLAAISRDPEIPKAYKDDPLCNRFNTVGQGDAILKALDKIPELVTRITVPTLILHGEADRIIKVEGSREIHARLAAKEKAIVTFRDAYHEVYNDLAKAEFLGELGKWVDAHV